MRLAPVTSKAMVATAMANVVGFLLLFLALTFLLLIDLGYAWYHDHGSVSRPGLRRSAFKLLNVDGNLGLTPRPLRGTEPLQTS